MAAAVLHDIGCAQSESGSHPLDGSQFLKTSDFSSLVCNLLVHYSGSLCEAEERGLDLSVYDKFAVEQDLGAAHAVLWCADLTTGSQGQDVTVEERLDEIRDRYGPDDVITRIMTRARPVLLVAGQSPTGVDPLAGLSQGPIDPHTLAAIDFQVADGVPRHPFDVCGLRTAVGSPQTYAAL